MCRGGTYQTKVIKDGAPGRRKKGGSQKRLMDVVKEDIQRGGVTEEDAGKDEMEADGPLW